MPSSTTASHSARPIHAGATPSTSSASSGAKRQSSRSAGVRDVLGEEEVDHGLGQQRTVGMPVRGRVLVRGGAGVEQHLQRQRQARVARLMAHTAASVPPALSPPTARRPASRPRLAPCFRDEREGVPRVVRCGRKLVRGRQPVVDRHHRAAALVAQHAAQRVVRADVADGEAATMKVHQHRQHLGRRRIEPRGYREAVARGDAEVFDARQLGLGHFEHARAFFVGGLGLVGGELLERGMAGARHALDHAGHLRGERRLGW
jgi:hypothetical protein